MGAQNYNYHTDFEHELDLEGTPLTVSIYTEASIYKESDYGADADGNRGQEAYFFDDITLEIKDLRGNDITSKIEKKYKKEYDRAIGACQDKVLEIFEKDI